jgi:hypothetical protein
MLRYSYRKYVFEKTMLKTYSIRRRKVNTYMYTGHMCQHRYSVDIDTNQYNIRKGAPDTYVC